MTKVFVIGFHKTGTTSLANALRVLGYSVTGPNGVNNKNIENDAEKIARRLIKKYDAFQDNPWPILYKKLDEWCPGSKFILTVRDSDSWLNSQVKHFGKQETPMRRWIYGAACPEGNEKVYVERYERHNNEVLEYFSGRNDLLVMSLGDGDEWKKLCAFLDKEILHCPFPKSNTFDYRMENQQGMKRVFRYFKRFFSK